MNNKAPIALEWDVATWSRALRFFEIKALESTIPLQKGLEIGARHGGLSWFFAHTFGSELYCTDVVEPSPKARELHQKMGVSTQITYQQADALALPFADQSVDFVVFKSVLGAIGRHNQPEKQQQALAEMYRVLKPGGRLFWAENTRASLLHQWMRRLFVPWGNTWRYVSLGELTDWLTLFEHSEIHSTGFLSAFIPRPEWLKNIAAQVDHCMPFWPSNGRYVAYGVAIKHL